MVPNSKHQATYGKQASNKEVPSEAFSCVSEWKSSPLTGLGGGLGALLEFKDSPEKHMLAETTKYTISRYYLKVPLVVHTGMWFN